MQVNKTYKVAVIDEILVSHAGLCFLINKLHDFKVVDNQTYYWNEHRKQSVFDVLLFSTRSIDEEVILKLKKIMAKNRRLPIVVLAPGISRAEQFKLISIDINGLIIQEATRLSLKESLLCVLHNGIYYPRPVMEELMDGSKRTVNGHLVKSAFTDM